MYPLQEDVEIKKDRPCGTRRNDEPQDILANPMDWESFAMPRTVSTLRTIKKTRQTLLDGWIRNPP